MRKQTRLPFWREQFDAPVMKQKVVAVAVAVVVAVVALMMAPVSTSIVPSSYFLIVARLFL